MLHYEVLFTTIKLKKKKKVVIRNMCREKLEILVNENKNTTDCSESKRARPGRWGPACSLGGVAPCACHRQLGPACPPTPTNCNPQRRGSVLNVLFLRGEVSVS